jgi:hypothetical protein
MVQLLGIIWCANVTLYTFSTDCAASKAGFNIISVPEYVCGDEAA